MTLDNNPTAPDNPTAPNNHPPSTHPDAVRVSASQDIHAGDNSAVPGPAAATNTALFGSAALPTALPTVGVDPGQTWTAAVLRVGDTAVHGWTLGPVDHQGRLFRGALNEPDDWRSFAWYVARLIPALDELVGYAIHHYGRVRVAVECPLIPVGFLDGRKQQRMPLRDWVVPRQVTAAVMGAYPDARPVRPDHMGRRHADEYPADLRGKRPSGWGPNEARRGERDHERAAYDIAGIGAMQP
jgi:hypothetical protein